MIRLKTMKNIKTYTELSRLVTFEDRLNYLQLNGQVGKDTFGFDRIFNQRFYRSREWKNIRNYVIDRDHGCDLGVEGYDIVGQSVLIHHMNPISLEDIENCSEFLLNPEYLISVTHATHNAIHYGDVKLAASRLSIIERSPNDTCPWRK